MSFDWVEYVKLANELAKQQEESYLRSAVSRAYYGIFCIARNKRGYKNYVAPDVHKKVIEDYKNSKKVKDKEIGKILDGLRRERNDADYNEDKIISKNLTERVIIRANEILKQI